MSGKISFVGEALQHGATVGINLVNASGGVLGHRLSAALQDDAGDPIDGVPAFHALELKNPSFELGPTVFTAPPVIGLYGAAKLPDFMIAGPTTYDKMQYNYVYRVTPSDSTLADGMAAYAIHKGLTHAALIFDNGQNSQTLVPPLVASYKSHGGTVVDAESVVPGQSSYQTTLQKVFSKHPDAVFFQADPQTSGTIFHEMEQLGELTVPIISTDNGAFISFANAMGLSYASKYLTGMLGANPSGPAYTTYVAGYKQQYQTDKPLDLSENTYDAVVIASLAMDAANSTDPSVWVKKVTQVSSPPGVMCYDYAGCLKDLKSGEDINYQGASGNEDFNQYHNVFGAWDVVQFDMSGGQHTLFHEPAGLIQQYATNT